MNLRQFGYFLKIAELQSFTRAASVLHVAQPSLSRQIQLLEQDLGVLLFVRSDKGAKLTEAGHALREGAQAVLQQVRQIRDDVGEHASAPKGELRFGVPPSLFDLLAVPLVCAYRARYPDVRLFVTEGISALMHKEVLTGEVDTAIVSDAEPLGTLRSQRLLREQLYLVGPREADLDLASELPIDALAEHSLILTGKPNAMRMIVENALAEIDRHADPVIETNSSRMLCELVAHGLGYTVLPFSAAGEAFRADRLTLAPLNGLSVTWTLVTAPERGLSVVGRKLRELITEVACARIASGAWLGVVALD